jgi:hypothetical protein
MAGTLKRMLHIQLIADADSDRTKEAGQIGSQLPISRITGKCLTTRSRHRLSDRGDQ